MISLTSLASHRRRTLVSIGTHDLDTIEGPFSYEALPPKNIEFVPLNRTQKVNAEELFVQLEVRRERMSVGVCVYVCAVRMCACVCFHG